MQMQFPAIFRFQDIEDVEIFKGPHKKGAREKQEHNLVVRIIDENPTMKGSLNLSASFISDQTVNPF